jgi:hypothetical protein
MLAHCAAENESSDSAPNAGVGGSGGGGPCIGAGCGTGGGSVGGADAGVPPEKELESSFRSPVATGRYVWTANPDSSRVARVDAKSFEARTFEAGFAPTHLVGLASPSGEDRALVINVGSHDASLFIADAKGDVTVHSAALHKGANAWAVSSSGKWAIAWTDFAQVAGADVTEGFQDVTVLDLSALPPVSTRLSVGYRPSRVFISQDDKQAFFVTEPGLSVVALDSSLGPLVERDVPMSDDPLSAPARDVTVTPDGSYALVRRNASADVTLVELASGTLKNITLSGGVTDIDLTEDGSLAIAVVRAPGVTPSADAGTTADAGGSSDAGGTSDAAADASGDASADAMDGAAADAMTPDTAPPPPAPDSEVFALPIPGVFSDVGQMKSQVLAGQVAGSVALGQSGNVAVVFTNASANDHLTLVDLKSGAGFLSYRTVSLKAPVLAAFVAPDDAHAIALLQPAAGSAKPGAFSIVPIAKNLPPKIQGTDAPTLAVSIAPAPSTRAIVTTRNDTTKNYATYLARMPELQVDRINLASPPLASGMVPSAGVAFVAQEHPEGRITFVNLEKGDARTLTGFELGAKVVD